MRFPTLLSIPVLLLAVAACGEGGDQAAGAAPDAPRPAAAVDETGRAAAAALLRDALDSLNMGNTAEARATYERAAEAFRRAGDEVGEGHVALGLAQLEHFTGQSDAARRHFAAALARYETAGAPAWEARALVAWGDLEKDTFNWDTAAGYYRRARALWAGVPDPGEADHVILRLAEVSSLPKPEAREVLKQAELIYNNLGDQVGIADIKVLSAELALSLGNLPSAQAYYSDARWIYETNELFLRSARSAEMVARLDIQRGYNERAWQTVAFSDESYARAGADAGVAALDIVRGDLERLQGRLGPARDYYAAAAAALAALGDPAEAAALLRRAQVESSLGDAAARASFAAARDRYVAAADESGEAAALLGAGPLLAAAGDAAAAESALARAATLFASVGDARGRGRALLEHARVAADAAALADHALQSFEQASAGAVFAQMLRGDLARAAGDDDAAATAYRAAADAFAALPSPLVAVNVLYGYPPIDTLLAQGLNVAESFYDDIAGGVRQRSPEEEAAIAANLAAFPDHLIEGRTILAALEAELAAAAAWVAARN